MFNWKCRNHLISTHLPSYGKPFFHFKFLNKKILEYIKLVELVVVQMIGSIEDEQCFFTLTFMKTKLKNLLMKHLELIIVMFNQRFFTMQNFPFGAVI
jgi:hypothetical protein